MGIEVLNRVGGFSTKRDGEWLGSMHAGVCMLSIEPLLNCIFTYHSPVLLFHFVGFVRCSTYPLPTGPVPSHSYPLAEGAGLGQWSPGPPILAPQVGGLGGGS